MRKARHELNLALDPAALRLGGRIRYAARSCDTYGEHEIDHLVFALADPPAVRPNDEEVAATRWLTKAQLAQWMARDDLTPWFRRIAEHLLLPGDVWEALAAGRTPAASTAIVDL